jgi:peroxiredoxin
MKKLIVILLIVICFDIQAQITTIAAGQTAPDFKLRNVDNNEISFASFPDAKGFIVVFTCNTCPVSKAYEQRIIALNNKFASAGYPVIAINPNDPDVSRGDSFEKMQDLAKAKKYPFPYLFDKGQVITNLYGARNTPHLFVVSKTTQGNMVVYTGAIDNDPEESNASPEKYVEQVVGSLVKGEKPSLSSTRAIGCTVKRKAK